MSDLILLLLSPCADHSRDLERKLNARCTFERLREKRTSNLCQVVSGLFIMEPGLFPTTSMRFSCLTFVFKKIFLMNLFGKGSFVDQSLLVNLIPK